MKINMQFGGTTLDGMKDGETKDGETKTRHAAREPESEAEPEFEAWVDNLIGAAGLALAAWMVFFFSG